MTTTGEKRTEGNQDDDVDTAVGALHGQVWLSVQTRQAQRLIRGRPRSPDKPAIVGLLGFADSLKAIWQAARHDDPYADWWLIQVEEGIAATRGRLQTLLTAFDEVLGAQEGLQITIAASTRPHRIALQFANPYSFRAAQMLSDYDRLMCTLMTLRHTGFEVPAALDKAAITSSRGLRRVFALPKGYHFFAIDRPAVRQGTQRARQALAMMGALPDDILCGVRLPNLRPRPVISDQPAGHGDVSENATQIASEAPLPGKPDSVGKD